MNADCRQVIVVDDDEVFRTRLAKALSERGFEVRTAQDVSSALELTQAIFPDYVLVDLKMPGEHGLVLVKALREMSENVRIVVLTGYGSIPNAVEAIRLGACEYLTKPADADQITAALLGESRTVGSEEKAYTLEQIEWEHIHRVLNEHQGNISATARALGIHRRSLQRKLAKWSPWT
jgi:two-component system, response regulator RegA